MLGPIDESKDTRKSMKSNETKSEMLKTSAS